MAVVKIENCSKTYPGPVEAVRDFSLDLNPGELTVLIGPSGCGKTTVLQMIAGLTEMDSGSVRINDQPVDSTNRNIAMMFQDSALFPWMNAWDNISYGLRKKGLSRTEIEEQVRKTAEQLQISDLLFRKVRTFSGGQKQRVALARSLCRQADLLLMDEPFSALDRELRLDLQQQLFQLCRERNQTVLMVTHDQNEALNLADKVVVMNEGRIIQTGSACELIRDPRTVFVARFVGEEPMNLWTVDHHILGIRPQHLKTEKQKGDLCIPVTVREVHWNGLVYRTVFDCYGQEGLMITDRKPSGTGNRKLYCDPGLVLYFDEKKGTRIK